MLFFCRSFLGGVGIRSRKLEIVAELSGSRKNTHRDTHDNNNNNNHNQTALRGVGLVWLAWLCFSLLSPVLFPPLSQQGSGHRVHGYSPPAPLLPWGAAAPLPQTGRPGQAAPAARPGPAVLRPGNLARGTQLKGNFGISQETIVGEEGVGCCVRFLYFPGDDLRESAPGEEGKSLPCGFLPFPPTPRLADSGGERCLVVVVVGCWEPHPGLASFLYLFHFAPAYWVPQSSQAVDSAS